jgi:hypothetical protein
MKFFIPGFEDDFAAAERFYEDLKKITISQLGRHIKISPRRIYSIDYFHNGKDMTATVGQKYKDSRYSVDGEVIAIFESDDDLCFVYTARHIVEGYGPILVGSEEVIRIKDFS